MVMPKTNAAVPKSTDDRTGKTVGIRSAARIASNNPTRMGRDKNRIRLHLLFKKFMGLILTLLPVIGK
jgi:hypothetical protein